MPKEGIPYALIIGALYKFMFYYFGYHKRGTKFLTFVILAFGIGFFIEIFVFFWPTDTVFLFQCIKKGNTALPEHPLFLFLYYFLAFFSVYMTIRLRNVNRTRKLKLRAKNMQASNVK